MPTGTNAVLWHSAEAATAAFQPTLVITYSANGCTATTTIQETGAGQVPDTYVDSGNTGDNYGITTTLKSKTGALNPLLKFDLASIPAGATITSASLGLTVTGNQTHTDTLYKMSTAWTEGTVNGNTCSTTLGGATWLSRPTARPAAAPTGPGPTLAAPTTSVALPSAPSRRLPRA